MNKFAKICLLLQLAFIATTANTAVTSGSAISDEPLGTGTGVAIKPNVYFVFDTSGSMAWDYLGDFVNDNYCFGNSKTQFLNLKTNGGTPPTIAEFTTAASTSANTSNKGIVSCTASHPPFATNAFNLLAYDPTTNYSPPVDYDQSTYPSMDGSDASHGGANWSSVKKDAYGVLTTSTINLASSYPDTEWCDDTTYTDCRRNTDGYQYPDLVKYTVAHTKNGSPFYYTMSPLHYCTDDTMTNCQDNSDATHTVPANYLWCTNYNANGSATVGGSAPTYTNCQRQRDSTHVVPTFLGKTVAMNAVVATGGSITVTGSAPFTGLQITAIEVAGVDLITSTIQGTSSDTASSLATAICTAIHGNAANSGFDCLSTTGARANLSVYNNVAGAAYNGAVVVTGAVNSTVVPPVYAVGSFRISTTPTASQRVDSIMVGSTQLLAAGAQVVPAPTSSPTQVGTAAAFCTAINANSNLSGYRARVVSTLGSGTPAWGSAGACTTCSTSSCNYVEIQSSVDNTAENGKVITISGPAANAPYATLSISGSRFAAGTRPGNLGTITVSAGTLFNSIPTTDVTTVANSNSQSVIDNGIRSKWAGLSGFSISGTAGSGTIIITAPAGTTYNGATITVNTGTTVAASAAVYPTSTLSITGASSTNKNLTSIKCGGTDVVPPGNYNTGTSTNSTTRMTAVATALNGRGANGYTVSCSGTSCTITAPTVPAACTSVTVTKDNSISVSVGNFTSGTAGSPGSDNLKTAITTPVTFNNGGSAGSIAVSNIVSMAGYVPGYTTGSLGTTTTPFTGGIDAKMRTNVGKFNRVDIVNDGRTFAKASTRTDCAGTTCTYAEEMTNFANWYTYYRTRCDTMKTGVLRAFSPVGSDFRVGFNTIYDGDHIDITDFTLANKQAWYSKVKAQTCSGSGTPLQTGLAAAGRYYAGKIHTTNDPIQYSCQKNFTILSTDGYWNQGNTTATDANGTVIGDQDGLTAHPDINTVNVSPNSPKAPYGDAANMAGTLADVAKWFYDHDLRNGPDTAALGSPGNAGIAPKSLANADAHYSNADIHSTTSDPAEWQHMVTFTLGLGMDGVLRYDPKYLTGSSADYEAVKAGTKTWGTPGNDKQENVDDLWHAAVNGHGQYFSAKNPAELVSALSTALSSIGGVLGSASASATSSLEPVANNNFLYAASYTTQEWTGDLEAREIDITNANAGTVSITPKWSAQAKLDARTDARTILTYDAGGSGDNGKAKVFSWANLTSAEQAYFSITGMSNYVANGTLATAAGCNTATAGSSPSKCSSLFSYITGSSTGGAAAFRARTHVLGDIVNSKPAFVGNPEFSYHDAGYATWKASVDRTKMVYAAANDGMLHAFTADANSGGVELWAYIPSFVLPNLWKLADTNYAGHHQYYVDGQITVGDAKIGSDWKTVLIGGLGKGGNGFYAIDITVPETPVVLWEFTTTDMGYSYGNPIITKLPDGTWVAILTSGYDNTTGDGAGHVYVVNIQTGALMYQFNTGNGTVANPSNLGKITNYVSDTKVSNTTMYLYAGDMRGNLWRFTPPAVTPASGTVLSGYPHVLKLMTTPSGTMITAAVEVGSVDGSDDHRMVLFGTGRYLSTEDKTDTTTQSIFGLYDSPLVTSATTVPVKTDLVQQTLCGLGLDPQPDACSAITNIPTTYRTTTQNNVILGVGDGFNRGWYVDLPDIGTGAERISVDMKLQLGTLTAYSNVPTSSDCNIGGYSWKYDLNYKTGSFIPTTDTNSPGLAGTKVANALVVGFTVVRIGDKIISLGTTADKKYPATSVPVSSTGGVTKRVGWREIIND